MGGMLAQKPTLCVSFFLGGLNYTKHPLRGKNSAGMKQDKAGGAIQQAMRNRRFRIPLFENERRDVRRYGGVTMRKAQLW